MHGSLQIDVTQVVFRLLKRVGLRQFIIGMPDLTHAHTHKLQYILEINKYIAVCVYDITNLCTNF